MSTMMDRNFHEVAQMKYEECGCNTCDDLDGNVYWA